MAENKQIKKKKNEYQWLTHCGVCSFLFLFAPQKSNKTKQWAMSVQLTYKLGVEISWSLNIAFFVE